MHLEVGSFQLLPEVAVLQGHDGLPLKSNCFPATAYAPELLRNQPVADVATSRDKKNMLEALTFLCEPVGFILRM